LATNAYASGGGASSSTLYNCTLTGNSAYNYGGAISCTLNNCALSGNSGIYVGGATSCMLTNCTLTGNSSVMSVGGTTFSTLFNCIVYFNTAPQEGNYDSSCALNYCCTTPQPGGIGNITDAPRFADTNGWADLHLQSNSTCINAGNNAFAPSGPDLDGNPRIAGGTVDIGAYEFQAPVSIISYAWLQQFNLPINASTDTADPDGDGVDNYHEWLAGTDPSNRFSSPAQLTIIPSGTNVILTWPTNAVGFTLQSTTNLVFSAVWGTNSPAPVVIGRQNVVTNPISGPQQFYRLVH
jgi:parallel beta-helix repeat protein/predicted outer membrane repeat protein